MPNPSPHVRERGSGVLNDFSCHSSPIRELESDCRTSSSTRSSMPAVQYTCTGNAIITFFTPFDPAPCDKKPQNTRPSFRFSGEGSRDETREGLGTRLPIKIKPPARPKKILGFYLQMFRYVCTRYIMVVSCSFIPFRKRGRGLIQQLVACLHQVRGSHGI